MDHYDGKSDSTLGGQEHAQNVARTQSQVKASNEDAKLVKMLNSLFESHLEKMVSQVISEFKINDDTWHKIMYSCTKQVVTTVKPTSVVLNDSIDINRFVKIVTVEYPN